MARRWTRTKKQTTDVHARTHTHATRVNKVAAVYILLNKQKTEAGVGTRTRMGTVSPRFIFRACVHGSSPRPFISPKQKTHKTQCVLDALSLTIPFYVCVCDAIKTHIRRRELFHGERLRCGSGASSGRAPMMTATKRRRNVPGDGGGDGVRRVLVYYHC